MHDTVLCPVHRKGRVFGLCEAQIQRMPVTYATPLDEPVIIEINDLQ